MNYREIRELASSKCAVNSSRLAVIYLVSMIISGVASFTIGEYDSTEFEISSSISSMIGMIISGPMTYGMIYVIKKNYENIRPEVEDLFKGFKFFTKLFVLNLLIGLYVGLWTLLFIIPGIIKAYSYSMAFYIFLDNPELSANECIDRSRKMMNGFKWHNFCLNFSYIGWILLSILTLGILFLWVGPKMQTANYEFYLIVSGNKNKRSEVDILESIDNGEEVVD